MSLSLLDEKCFTIKSLFGKKSEKVLSLPELFQALCQEKAFSMPKLQAHQQHGVYSFLANLMALCLDQEIDMDNKTPISVSTLRSKTAEDWKQLLVRLMGKDTTAFDLIVEDMSKPAFFQPATQLALKGDEDLEKGKQPTRDTPDNFSIIHDKQGFDIKRSRNHKNDVELWVYALIVMQTCCNYGGVSWHRAIKLETSESTRVCASYVDKPFFNVRIQRDVPLLLAQRSKLVDTFGYRSQFKLLWLIERTETNQIDLEDCHPLFIECARIYRFTKTDAGINLFGIGRKLDFIKDTKVYRGVVGDFWLPIVKEDKKDGEQSLSAMSLRKDGIGFDYKQTTNILLNKTVNTPAVALPETKNGFKQGFLLLDGISGGQCKTAGFHRKYIVMTKGMISRFSKASADVQLAEQLQTLMTKYSGYIALVWEYLVQNSLRIAKQNDRAVRWSEIFEDAKMHYEDQAEIILFDALYSYSEQDENDSTEKIEEDFIVRLDQLAFEIREQIFQRSFANSVGHYSHYALLNSTVLKQKFFLNKKISLLEITPHMSQIQKPETYNVYRNKVLDALGLIRKNSQNSSFIADLRKPSVYAAPEFNPAYQEMIAQIYGKSLKSANLSEKEIQLWQNLFAWMRTSKGTNNENDLGTLCQKAGISNLRFLSLLEHSEESLIVEIEGLLSIITSSKFEISTRAWVDIAALLFSDGTDDEIAVRRGIANSYYDAIYKTTQKPTKTTQNQNQPIEINNLEQKNV